MAQGPKTTERSPDDSEPERRAEVDDVKSEATEANPDPTTRREAFELELMDRDESDLGAGVDHVSDR